MTPHRRINRSAVAAAGIVLALAAGGISAHADPVQTNFGPVAPSEPILATIGGQRIIAFFVPERGSCAVTPSSGKTPGWRPLMPRRASR